jgi:hypothetical protein
MGRIEQLAEIYGRHIGMPWQQTVSGAQRVIMIVYDKELERTLIARKNEFQIATEKAGHHWTEIDIAGTFARWMASEEYREAYFESPSDLQLKLEVEFAKFVAQEILEELKTTGLRDDSVLAIFGVGALFGFTRVSRVLKIVEPSIKGRLAVFFPGTFDNNNYRLLDARDGWNYLAVPITLHGTGAV